MSRRSQIFEGTHCRYRRDCYRHQDGNPLPATVKVTHTITDHPWQVTKTTTKHLTSTIVEEPTRTTTLHATSTLSQTVHVTATDLTTLRLLERLLPPEAPAHTVYVTGL